jgi:tyrosyl-tRNA synthetase
MGLEEQLRNIKRGSIELISEEELIIKLKQNRPLNIKFGIDPTAPDIHLGHTVPLQKLRQFQDEGHNIHLIIGDYTAMIGDPSGRSEARPMLTKDEISKNLKTYTEQVFKILDPNLTKILYNSQWLGQFTGEDMIKLASRYTVQQLLQRRDFSNRIAENRPLSLSELIYPLLVGYDSVHLQTDIEIGGSDQLFNFVTSRSLQSAYGQMPEIILILPLLEGIDGQKKMSKSLNNAIGVTEEPSEMYGKLMSINDNLMLKYYELLSNIPTGELDHIKRNVLEKTENPLIYKKRLAREIVARYHSEVAAEYAENNFSQVVQKKNVPETVEKMEVKYASHDDLSLVGILRKTGIPSSNSEARRLINQRAVKINGETVTDVLYSIEPIDGTIMKVGKRNFRELYFTKGQDT